MRYSEVVNTLQNLTKYPIRQIDLVKATGITRATMSYREKKNSAFTLEDIEKINKYYNVDLLAGTKKMSEAEAIQAVNQVTKYLNSNNLDKDDLVTALANDYANSKMQQITDGNCVKVAFRPEVYLSAGYGIEIQDEHKEFMCLDERLFFTDRGVKINPNNCEVVTVSGNSMAPEYRHGDRVILDKSVKYWIDGHIFAFRYQGECFIKEICLLGKKVKAIPLNKEYEPFFIEENEDVEIFGRIIPRVRL